MINKLIGKGFMGKVKVISFILLLSIQFIGLNILAPLESYVGDYFINEVSIQQSEEEIALVLVSDRTINEIGKWPINRHIYADLLNDYFLDSKVVAFDFLFPNKTDDDLYFSEAIKHSNNVVLAYVDEFNNQDLVTPTISLLENTNRIGYVNYFVDEDGYSRYYKFSESKGGLLRKSLVSSILSEIGYELQPNDMTNEIIRISDQEVMYNFKENDSSNYRVLKSDLRDVTIYELGDIYNGRYSKNEFDDKIILIGGSFTGASDTINTPVKPTLGVKYVYDAITTIFSGKQPVHIPNGIQVLTLFFVLLFIIYISRRLKPIVITLIIVCINVLYVVVYIFLFSKYLIYFDVVHLIVITTTYFVMQIVSRVMQSDNNIMEINTSLEHILNLEEYLLNEVNFQVYLDMLNEEVLIQKNLNILGIYTSLEFEALDFGSEPEKIVLEDMHIFIPIRDDEERKIVVIEQLKKRKLKELNYIIALIVSASAFYSNKNVVEKKNKMFFNIFKSLVSAMDAKDPITGNHSEKVAEVSVEIGKLLGYSNQKIELLRISGLIHDVGKIGISEKILNKPCFFNDEDMNEMKKHPVMGGKILKIDEIDDEIYKTILQHHERIDGKGYPYGLKGNQISEFSKIVKIADVYDALRSKRQYKEAWGLKKVIKILKSGSGTEFDKVIVDMFIKDLESKELKDSVIIDTVTDKKNDIPPSICDIWKNCQPIVSKNRSANGFIAPIDTDDFIHGKQVEFCHLKLGDYIMTRKWLNLKPRHAIAAVNNEFDYYTLQTNTQYQQAVFVFYKEYANALYLESDTLKKDEIIEDLEEVYGESTRIVDGFSIWQNRDLYIVVKEVEENNSVGLAIIHKYCL